MFRAGIDNVKFAASNHNLANCTSCHGGADGVGDRAIAHAGMQSIPGGDKCIGCHANEVVLAGSSLHVNPTGFKDILGDRQVDFTAGTESLRRFEKQCTKCHIRNSAAQAACGYCHISVPNSAGGGLIAGHNMNRTPSTVNNCTACHGSRVKDEYFGLNQALFTRNLDTTKGSTIPADYVFRTTPLQPDVHKAGGRDCVFCHQAGEMHGSGAGAGMDRYGVTGGPQCASCHSATDPVGGAAFAAVGLHTAKHLETMSCHVCHSQPYKQCFGCHTQETPAGVGYYVINENDPTRDERYVVPAAWSSTTAYAAGAFVTYNAVEYKSLQASNTNHVPDAVGSTWWVAASAYPAGDALITFRVGLNPKFGTELGAPKYAVLRHVPIDADTFAYTKEGTLTPGLVPGLTGLPTWKYASPHNIARVTPIQSACTNCHGADYAKFWLTDPVGNAFGWMGADAAALAAEQTANASVVQSVPLPQTAP